MDSGRREVEPGGRSQFKRWDVDGNGRRMERDQVIQHLLSTICSATSDSLPKGLTYSGGFRSTHQIALKRSAARKNIWSQCGFRHIVAAEVCVSLAL